MTLYLEAPGPFPVWTGEAINGVCWGLDIEYLWTPEDLEGVGLWRDDMIAPAATPPLGDRTLSREVRRVEGVVRHVYVTEAISFDEAKAAKLEQLAARRWEIETGGVTVGGLSVPSDRDTQGRIAQIVAAYDKGFVTGPVLFKLAPGVHIEIDEVAIRAVMEAGAQLIQSCFRREGELAALVVAATDLAALEAIDIQGFWP